MKKDFISLLVVAVFVFGLFSCTGKGGKETQEEAAVIAGSIPKSILTEEVKAETIQFLKGLPELAFPDHPAVGEAGEDALSYLLPLKAAELTSSTGKAAACGVYFIDYNTLKYLGQSVSEVENVLDKLTFDLDITYVLTILKETPPPGASKDESKKFLQDQEGRIIEELAANDRVDIQIAFLCGVTAELACLYAAWGELSDTLSKRLEILVEIADDLAAYYPDLTKVGDTIALLKEKVNFVEDAREITEIRDALLK